MPVIFNFLFAIFRRILPAKLTARLVTFSGNNIEAANLPSRCVPKEYGGEVESDNIQKFIEAIEKRAPEIESKFAYLTKWVGEPTDSTEDNECLPDGDEQLGTEI